MQDEYFSQKPEMQNQRIQMLETFLGEDPGDSFSKYALALEYVAEGNIQKGIDLLIELRNSDPEYLALYYQLGKLFEQQNNISEAVICFKKGIEIASHQNNHHAKAELNMALNELEDLYDE